MRGGGANIACEEAKSVSPRSNVRGASQIEKQQSVMATGPTSLNDTDHIYSEASCHPVRVAAQSDPGLQGSTAGHVR